MRLVKMLYPILISLVLALASLWIVRNFLLAVIYESPDLPFPADPPWEEFFAVLGIIYAIVVGLLLVEVLRRFHALSSVILDEFNDVEDIRDFLIYLDKNEETKKNIRKVLLKHVNSVLERDWAIMKKNPVEMDSDTSDELKELMEAVHEIKTRNESDRVALAAIINKIADLTSHRTMRLELATEHLRPAVRFLIVFMSVILVVSLLMINVANPWIHGLMVLSVVIASHLLYIVLSDINHPFHGLWNIEVTPFKRLVDTWTTE